MRKSLIIYFMLFLSILSCSKTYKVSSESMEPTLMPDDFIEISNGFYFKPQKGDIIGYYSPIKIEADKIYIHRCIAVEGDIFDVKDGQVYINNKKIIETYTKGITYLYYSGDNKKNDIRGVVPKDMIICLGDNRENAFDSRVFGYISVSTIIGKVRKLEKNN